MKFLSKPAIIAPPTGTRKFLSVDCTKASNLPFLKACKHINFGNEEQNYTRSDSQAYLFYKVHAFGGLNAISVVCYMRYVEFLAEYSHFF
jgi:hypothetical protein